MSTKHTIHTLGDLLEQFLTYEKGKIEEFEKSDINLTHGPTIGDIYEGLTSKFINHAIPINLGLRIVEGFIVDKNGKQLSAQTDCMLVKGEQGIIIPNTSHEIIELHNVLAIFEIKKSLYKDDFSDILEHFDKLMELDPINTDSVDAKSIYQTFERTTGIHLNSFQEASNLNFSNSLIFHSLVSEHARPLKIAIAYDGYKKHSNFRAGIVSLMEENIGKEWKIPSSWPDLVICGKYSLVKMNGRPFLTPIDNQWWNLFTTTEHNPIKLILELLYTKISLTNNSPDFWGEDLEDESLYPFLKTQAMEKEDVKGWLWEYIELTDRELMKSKIPMPWEPFFPDKDETITLKLILDNPDGLSITEIEKGIGDKAIPLIKRLISTGFVSQKNDLLFLTTEKAIMGFLPGGKAFFGEDNTGRLTRWLQKYMKKLRDEE